MIGWLKINENLADTKKNKTKIQQF